MPRCKKCKEKFTPKTFLQKFCMEKEACITAFLEFKKEAEEKQRKKKWKKEKKVLKEKLETKSDLEKKLQKEINTIVRLIDKDHPCISSGRPLGKNFDAGHLYSRGGHPEIKFHLFNIFAQSVSENQHNGGNPLGFMEGLEETFGEEMKEFCLALKGLKSIHLEKHELRDKISIARGIVKWLKLQDRQFTKKERIELRIKFNEELGIYKN